MVNWYLYIFTDEHLWTYIYYIVMTYLLHSCEMNLWHFFQLCSCCCFSEVLFIINLPTVDMVGIDYGWSDMAWVISSVPLWGGISLIDMVEESLFTVDILTYSWHGWHRLWMKWYGMGDKFCSPMGRNFIDWYGWRIIVYSRYTSVSPPKHFFNFIHIVGMVSNMTCIFASQFSMKFYV